MENSSDTDTKKILIYTGDDLIGDALMKLPFLNALRQAFPNAHIIWLTKKGQTVFTTVLKSLVKNLINEVIEEESIGTKWHEIFSTPLYGQYFDLVIDTQRRLKTTLIIRKIPHGKFISGTANYFFSDLKPKSRHKKIHIIDTILDLVSAASGKSVKVNMQITINDHYLAAAKAALPNKNYVGLSPGAGGQHKRWPLENYISIGLALLRDNITPVYILGPNEKDLVEEVRSKIPSALFPLQDKNISEEHRKSVEFTIALGKRLICAIANDSGTGHILAASNVKLISLFGPTNSKKFAPYVEMGVIIEANNGNMNNIQVNQVLKECLKLVETYKV